MSDVTEFWDKCASSIREEVSDAVWQSTFDDARPISINDDVLRLSVPSLIVKEKIEGRYLALVCDALNEAAGTDVNMLIEVRSDSTATADTGAAADGAGNGEDLPVAVEYQSLEQVELTRTNAVATGGTDAERDDVLHALNPRYTFGSFVTGASNRFAEAAALSVAETPARSYNPLFIYGDAGLGKTHLLHAIAYYVRENYPSYTVRYVSTETFLNQFVDAIRTNDRHTFKRRYREIDVLLVDDIQFIEGREGLQEEFFHTFNTLHQATRQIVISSDRPPDAISTLEDRLRSRFKMGLITDIQPPDIETRLAILRKKGEGEGARAPDEVLEFIANHVTDNIRELEGALIRVCAFASLTQETLNVELAQHVLSDIVSQNEPREITPDIILEATSKRFSFSIEEIQGVSRRRPLVTARQIAMYVMRQLTDMSYPAIAREFGGRDHTTVIHAVEKISNLMSERRQIYDQVTELIQTIKNGDRAAA